MTLINILLASRISTALNSIIADYLIPFYGFAILMGVIAGIVKNWESINDNTGNGRRKEGFINIAWIVGYVVLAEAATVGIGSLIRGMTITI